MFPLKLAAEIIFGCYVFVFSSPVCFLAGIFTRHSRSVKLSQNTYKKEITNMSPAMFASCSLHLASQESTACHTHPLMKQIAAEKSRDKEKC